MNKLLFGSIIAMVNISNEEDEVGVAEADPSCIVASTCSNKLGINIFYA